MKRKMLSFLLVLAIILIPNVYLTTMISADSSSTGSVSQWSAEGNANDSINGNDGTLLNGVTYTTGKVGQAFYFDGDYACVEIPSNPSIMPANITVEAWVKPDRVGERQSIVSKWGGYGDASYSLELEGNQFIFYLHDGITTQYLWGGPVVTAGNWYHVAGTYDGTQARLYVNHDLVVGPISVVAPMTDSNVPLRIGASVIGTFPDYYIYVPFQGSVDEVRIWNRALNLSQVPTSTVVYNPNALNLKSKGGTNSFTGYLEFPTGYDINLIDISTVKITVNNSQISAQLSPISTSDFDGDKIPDCMIKFDRQAIINTLAGTTGNITISINGSLTDGLTFTGSNIINVINPTK